MSAILTLPLSRPSPITRMLAGFRSLNMSIFQYKLFCCGGEGKQLPTCVAPSWHGGSGFHQGSVEICNVSQGKIPKCSYTWYNRLFTIPLCTSTGFLFALAALIKNISCMTPNMMLTGFTCDTWWCATSHAHCNRTTTRLSGLCGKETPGNVTFYLDQNNWIVLPSGGWSHWCASVHARAQSPCGGT